MVANPERLEPASPIDATADEHAELESTHWRMDDMGQRAVRRESSCSAVGVADICERSVIRAPMPS